jgi:hypothetical protein
VTRSPGVTIMIHRDGAPESKSVRAPLWFVRLAAIVGTICGIVIVVVAIVFTPIARSAARVPSLTTEINQLREENLQVRELAATLGRLEGTYSQVRSMMGGEIVRARPNVFFASLPVATPIRAALPGVGSLFDRSQSLPLTWPLVDVGFVTREYVADGPDAHPGIDVAVSMETPIRAAASGIVGEAGVDSVYGRYVLVDHAEGYQTVYGHSSRTLVSAGDSVVTGEVVGLTGSTGRSTAPHLHFEIRHNGRSVDPRQVIEEVP